MNASNALGAWVALGIVAMSTASPKPMISVM